MDKLRALQYFVAAAETRSFSAAARRHEVSIPAVAKLITSLERELGARLLDRSFHGLTLTAEGQRYLEDCQPLLERLAAADDAISSALRRPRGTVTIGTHASLARRCILPALPGFHTRYPDVQIDIRDVNRINHPEAHLADVLVVLGWPEDPDYVHRTIAQPRALICAAPEYWAARGVPQRPKDLERHLCLLFRNQEGIVIDLWRHERGGASESVKVTGRLISSHSDVVLNAAIAGEGIARIQDLTILPHLRQGRLVPVLLDWETRDSPPVNLLYRAGRSRAPRVKVFVDFVTELFRSLEGEREGGAVAQPSSARPSWYGRPYGRASATAIHTNDR